MSNITDYYNDLTAIPGVPPSQAAAVAVTQSLSDDVLIDGFIRIVEAGYEKPSGDYDTRTEQLADQVIDIVYDIVGSEALAEGAELVQGVSA